MYVRVEGREVHVIADMRYFEDILMDLRHARDWYELEPCTEDFIEKLREKGVE